MALRIEIDIIQNSKYYTIMQEITRIKIKVTIVMKIVIFAVMIIIKLINQSVFVTSTAS